MAERRRYTKRQKAVAVTAALATSMTAASEATGIPLTTIDYWMDRPEFVALRNKTADDLAVEMQSLAHLAAEQLAVALRSGSVEPRDLIVALGVTTDKAQLLSGRATSRTESKSLMDSLDDHERDALKRAIDSAISVGPDAEGEAAGDTALVAVEDAAS